MSTEPLPFPADRRPRPRLPQSRVDNLAAILARVDAARDELDEIAELLVVEIARREGP